MLPLSPTVILPSKHLKSPIVVLGRVLINILLVCTWNSNHIGSIIAINKLTLVNVLIFI